MPRSALIALLLSAPCFAGTRIDVRDGFPFVDARINGRGPFRLLIDTGADSCMLSPDAARKAGLVFDHRVILTSLGGEKIIPGASNNQVEAGGAARSGVDVVVAEMGQLRSLDRAADGVLGQSFLSRSAYLIDFEEQRLWLGEEAVARAGRLPIEVAGVEWHGRPFVPVTLDSSGRAWLLTVDSGASSLVVACSERCPGLRDIRRDSFLATHVVERPVSRGTLRQVEIGGVGIPGAEGVILHRPSSDDDGDGVLPARWFSAVYVNRSTVRLALPRGVIVF